VAQLVAQVGLCWLLKWDYLVALVGLLVALSFCGSIGGSSGIMLVAQVGLFSGSSGIISGSSSIFLWLKLDYSILVAQGGLCWRLEWDYLVALVGLLVALVLCLWLKLDYIVGSRGIMLADKVGLCSSSRRIIRGSSLIFCGSSCIISWWLKWDYFGG
jgi:hypothetical protein